MKFKDRTEAGKVLSEMMTDYRENDCIVLALPNGGIPVGLEISVRLGLEFNLILVSKITPKFNSEVGYGSVSETGTVNLNRELIDRFNLTDDEVELDIEKTRRKIESRRIDYGLQPDRYRIRGKTVILVDDGIASGFTMINAVDTIKKKDAEKVVIAVPTSPLSSSIMLKEQVDDFICPDIRDTHMFAVANAYINWHDISSEEALEYFEKYGFLDS